MNPTGPFSKPQDFPFTKDSPGQPAHHRSVARQPSHDPGAPTWGWASPELTDRHLLRAGERDSRAPPGRRRAGISSAKAEARPRQWALEPGPGHLLRGPQTPALGALAPGAPHEPRSFGSAPRQVHVVNPPSRLGRMAPVLKDPTRNGRKRQFPGRGSRIDAGWRRPTSPHPPRCSWDRVCTTAPSPLSCCGPHVPMCALRAARDT